MAAVTAECKVSTLLGQIKSDNKEVHLKNPINKKSSSRNLDGSLDSLGTTKIKNNYIGLDFNTKGGAKYKTSKSKILR